MIRIKKVRFIPRYAVTKFVPYSFQEWEKIKPHRLELYSRLSKMYVLTIDDEPLLFVGFIPGTWLGHGVEVVMFLCEDLKKHLITAIRFMRRTLAKLLRVFYKLSASVEVSFTAGHKFVKFLGFKLVAENSNLNYVLHNYYEMRLH